MYTELNQNEYEIMKIIWNEPNGILFGELYDKIAYREMSRQNLNKIIQQLVQKGYIRFEGGERKRIYLARISKQEYDSYMSNKILNQLFDGSIGKFIAALSGKEQMTDKTAKELRKLLRAQKKGDS